MNMFKTLVALMLAAFALGSGMSFAIDNSNEQPDRKSRNIQLGPRPYFLVSDMQMSRLKKKLSSCSEGPFHKTDFSIGHRGAPLQFPEHTKESYEAAARMGAGILECDVTFTKDKELVCRHSQCDLHTTTDILTTPLAAKCSVPPDYSSATPFANVNCCTSDLTLKEFKTLKGKMDAGNPKAKTLAEYLDSTPNFRTDLYSGRGTLLTHRESIQLFKKLGAKMTPELKSPSVAMPFNGFSQQDYAQKLIDEYKQENVSPRHVYAQSFDYGDILYWIKHEPKFGKQAVYLETLDTPDQVPAAIAKLPQLVSEGVKIVAPPMWVLLTLDANNNIVPSDYALAAKDAGLDIITWTLERSGLLGKIKNNPYYYQSVLDGVKSDGDTMVALDVLARQVGILGIFSDWPATVTYYANCMNLD